MENINRGFERKYGSILESCDKNKKKVEECDKVKECDKKTSSKKELQESPVYGLKNEYDSKGFGGKAQVETDNKGNETLYSYDTPVVKISGDKVTLLPKWNSSATTLRHVKEFLKQHDLKAESKAQIAKDYMTESCGRSRRKSIRELLEEISPEDQHDSDLLRSVILKSRDRKNASLTKDERDVMDKYGLTRANGGIYKKGKENKTNYKLDRDVDSSYWGDDFIDPEASSGVTRELSKGRNFPRGIDKVNLADRARKLDARGGLKKVGNVLVYRDADKNYDYSNTSWRDAEAADMQAPYIETRGALGGRKDIKRYRDLAQRDYDIAVANAKRKLDSSTKYLDSREDYVNDIIDRNLKRGKYAPATESFRRRRIKEGRGVEIDDTFDEINVFLQGDEFEKTTRPGKKGRSRITGIVSYKQVGVTRDGDIRVRVRDEKEAKKVTDAVSKKFGDVVEISKENVPYDTRLPIHVIIKVKEGVIDDIDKKFKKKNESVVKEAHEKTKYFSDLHKAERYAEKNGLVLAEYGPLNPMEVDGYQYAYFNKTGKRKDGATVLAYYAMDNGGHARPLDDSEVEYIEQKEYVTFHESIGSDVAEYQKWVDYDMKRYKKISEKTMSKIKKAGLSVVKDQYGDYEVIAKEPVKESIAKKTKNRALIREAVRNTQQKKKNTSK